MKKIKIITVLCILMVSCGTTSQSSVSNDECNYERQLEILVAKVIDTPELQQFYNVQNGLKQDNLVILKNTKIKKSFKKEKFERPILFLTNSEISKRNIKAFLEFEQISITEQIAKVKLIYKIQGIEYNAKYKLINCEWELIEKQLYER